jgi:hypothetical protein
VAIAALAAAVLLVWLVAPWSDAADPARVEMRLVRGDLRVDGRQVQPGSTVHVDQRLAANRDAALLRIEEPVTVALEQGARLLPTVLSAGEVELGLADGMVAVRVDPGATVALRVVAAGGVAQVTGTVFAVSVLADRVRVDVVRGAVACRAASDEGGEEMTVAAGESLLLGEGRVDALKPEIEDRIRELLDLPPVERPAAVQRPEPQVDTEAASETQPSETDGGREDDDRTRADLPSLGSLIVAARECRARKDWHCAAANYRQIQKLYAGSSEATDMLVPLAEIEITNLGQPGSALRHFRKYIKRKPGGALAEESRYGLCRALRALKRRDQERDALEAFVAAHPGSEYALQARARLSELGD